MGRICGHICGYLIQVMYAQPTGQYQMDCGFPGKSTKMGIVDVKEVLKDFRYSAKLNFSHGVHKMTKSKMATNRSVKI